MRHVLGFMSAAVLAVILASGCADSPKMGMPCDNCKFRVADTKGQPPKLFCKVDGKEVDCRKSPAECPECAKMTK